MAREGIRVSADHLLCPAERLRRRAVSVVALWTKGRP